MSSDNTLRQRISSSVKDPAQIRRAFEAARAARGDNNNNSDENGDPNDYSGPIR